MQNISMKAENMVKEIKQTGVINEASTTIKSIRKSMDSLDSDQNFGIISAMRNVAIN